MKVKGRTDARTHLLPAFSWFVTYCRRPANSMGYFRKTAPQRLARPEEWWESKTLTSICIRIHKRPTEERHTFVLRAGFWAARPKHLKKWHLTSNKSVRRWDQYIQHLDISEDCWRGSHSLWSHDEMVVSSCFIFSFSGLAKASIMQSGHTVKGSNRSWHAL